MATGNNPQLNIGPSKESQSELQKFLRMMESIQRTVKATEKDFEVMQTVLGNNAQLLSTLKQDMKTFKTLADGMKRNSAMLAGPGSYFQGQQFRANRSAAGTARLGTEVGQQIALQQETLRLAKQGLTYAQQQATLQQALNLKLGTQARTINKITDLEKARKMAAAAQVRIGLEAANGEAKRMKSAQRIYDLAKARVTALEQEKRSSEQLAKAEERRAQRLKNLRYGDRQVERAEAAAGRRKSFDRLFGDGGAALFGVQAGLMANYAVMNGARNTATGGVRFAADLDEGLRNLQAITVVTDENLASLKEEILDVSEATKFFATDIADAAVTLGQAGFSTKEIEDSIRAVALLATATGTDLAKSVDLTTSILGVFNMESAQMTNVADTLTAAVNNSKLNIDKLALGMQYAGNTASQSGVSFEELTASLGAMANAGIRSGSTLGTGMRQILIALQKPSGKFKESLDRLGLSMADVDLRANGLYGVMQNLKEGGFTAGDAIRSFEVRAAAAFNALSGNLDEVVKLERAFLNSSAAMEANETQMRALSNQWRRFQANLQAVVSTGLEPLVYATRDGLKALADMLQTWREYPTTLRAVITGFTSLAAGMIAARTAWLAMNVIGMITGIKKLYTTLMALRAGAALASLSFGPIAIALAGVATATYVGITAFSRYARETEKVNDIVEKAQTAFDNAAGAMEDTASRIGMIDDRIKSLTDRSELLNSEQNLLQLEADKVREQFHGMGLQLDTNVSSTGTLITALQELRQELANDYVINIRASEQSLRNLLDANQMKGDDLRSNLSWYADHRGIQNSWRRNGRSQFMDLVDQARSPDATLMDMQDAYTQASSLQSKYLAEGTSRGERKAMEDTLSYMDQLIRLKQRDLSLTQQLRDLHESEKNAQIKALYGGPNGIVGKVSNFEVGRDTRISNATNSAKGGAVERFKAGKAELAVMEDEAEALIAAIDAHAGLNDAVKEELKRNVENAVATAQLAVAQLGESAKTVAEDAAEAEMIRRETEQNRLKSEQTKSENAGDIQTLGIRRLTGLYGAKDAEIEALKADHNQDTTTELYKAELAAIEEKYARRAEAVQRETAQHLARVKNIEIQQLQNQQRMLELELDQAVTVEDKTGIRDKLAEVAVALGEAQKERNALLIEGADALATAQEETDAATEEALAKLGEDNEEDRVKAAERDVEIAQRALDAVEDLARTAVNNKQIAEAQQKKAKALADYAEAVNTLAQVKTDTGDGTEEQNTEDAQNAVEEATRSADKVFQAATRRVKRGNGGGNPYSKKRDYIDQLIDDLEAKLTLAENYLKSGKKVSTEYDDVMETALNKVSEINGQIDVLHAKMAAGGLTSGEQEKLNGLIDQQARLTTFIAKEEMRIAHIKLQQGRYQEGILLTTKAWAKENLNLATTLQEGLTGALSNAKSALTEFFATWSDGTKSGKQAFKDLTISVIKSIQNIFAEMLAVYLLQKALGWAGKLIGGDFGAELTDMAANLKEGGQVKNAAAGEYVKGNLNRDSQRYNLMPGEYVLRRSAVQAIGVDELDRLNAMGNTVASNSQHHGAAPSQSQKPGRRGDMNIYLIDERSQAGAVGPNDILAVVNDDIAKGGTTKKLIKSVQMGNM